ncbi:MAG: alpha/beta fold hydrolase [Gemmataceae bacterium]
MVEPAIQQFQASDAYAWKYRRFEATGAPRGSIIVLHGIQSHSGWYLESAEALAKRGRQVSLLDRRGSGLNDEGRGDAPSFRRLLDDIAEFMATLSQPRFLIGISWGGKLAVALQRRHPGLCQGLVLIGPGICPRVRPPLTARLAIAASRPFAPIKTFPIPLNEPRLFTDNPKRQASIAEDPLSLREATARLLFESARLDFYLRRCPAAVQIPTLLLLAGHDRIIDNARTRDYVSRFRGPTDVIEYPSAHHTLEFEPDGPPFLDDLAHWLEKV